MGIVSNAMWILSGVYLALGLVYLRFWTSERFRTDYLAFAFCTLSTTIYAWFELGMIKSQTPEEYLFFAWWDFLVAVAVSLSIAWFAYTNLNGRRWLFWTYCTYRMTGLVAHLFLPNGINFREITSIAKLSFLGETLSYPVVVPNEWMILAHTSHILLVIFCLDASVRSWRLGKRRNAVIFGTGVVLSRTIGSAAAVGVLWGFLPLPFFTSFSIAFVIAAMLYELNYDMHRAAMLAGEIERRDEHLSETLEQLHLAADAAQVGMWTRKVGGEIIWISEKAGEIFDLPKGTQLTREKLFQRIYPDDRRIMQDVIRKLEASGGEFSFEYRVLRENGNVRWLHSRGKVEELNGERVIRGAIVDITKVKAAEEAIRDLSGRLLSAQEKERARLARELHDGLNQSVALLSIQLGMLRNHPRDIEHIKEELGHFAKAVESLSEDVHRISYELHPANLQQLGLEAAVSTLCRDLAAAHPLKIDFHASDLPNELSSDVSLCLYRVVQESLHNVIKHSGATSAHVTMRSDGDGIRLVVADDGKGFEHTPKTGKGGLGLVSIDERVRRLNGRTEIRSSIGAGTKVEVFVPLHANAQEDVAHRLSPTLQIQ